MALNFNVDPYYDDFDPTKNFHRILFKPGAAVQARELTQSQTILQNQISNFADHIFSQNTPVSGGKVTTNLNCYFLKLNTQYNGVDIVAADFLNKEIQDATGIVRAKVVATSEAASDDPATLIINYYSGAQFTDAIDVFPSDGSNFVASTIGVTNGTTCTGKSSTASISDGIFYVVNGYSTSSTSNEDGTFSKYSIGNFVSVSPQTVILDKYSNSPTYRVGLQITETIEDYIDDASLLDPAVGASNYQAPGADRYVVSLDLITLPLTPGNDDQFIELLRIENGNIIKQLDTTVYAVIDDYFAKRDYETNGDYIVDDFKLTPSTNTTNSAQYDLKIGKGLAYVRGYRIENQSDILLTNDRSRNTDSILNNAVFIDYGSYFTINAIKGKFDITTMPQVDLHCVANDSIVSTNTTTYNSTLVGSGYIRNLQYVTSTTDANTSSYVYKAYVSDIDAITLNGTAASGTAANITFSSTNGKFSSVANAYYGVTIAITGGTSIGDRRKIVSYNGTTRTATVDIPFTLTPDSTSTFDLLFNTAVTESLVTRNSSNVVIATAHIDNSGKQGGLVTGDTIFSNPSMPEMIFTIGYPFLANISNSNYVTTRVFRSKAFTSVGPNSSLSITIPTATPMTFLGSGTLSSDTIKQNYTVIDQATGRILDFCTSGNTVSLSSNKKTVTFTSSTYSNPTVDVIVDVAVSNADNVTNVLKTKNLVVGNTTVVSIAGPSGIISSNTYVDLNNAQVYIKQAAVSRRMSLYVNDVKRIVKIIDTKNPATAATDAMLADASYDVTNLFNLDNGQRDNYYDHAVIELVAGASVPKGNILVVFDYYSHTGGDGYFDVNSYLTPISSSPEEYQDIPIYTSRGGTTYRLADNIDFRPARKNAQADFIFEYTGNPTIDDTGILLPQNLNEYVSDYAYYLGRNDKLVLTKDQAFKIVQGTPSVVPLLPSEPDSSLVLANLYHDPFTAYVPGEAPPGINANLSIEKVLHKNWIKRDITNLQTRVNNLEYYSSLSLLEQNAQSLQVPDVNGLNRFKNGILVDDFSSYLTADTKNVDYAAKINTTKKRLSPLQIVDNFQLQNPIVLNSLGTLKQTNSFAVSSVSGTSTNIFTLPYTTANVIEQKLASSTVSLNPFGVSIIEGIAKLNPPMDNWVDNTQAPGIVIADPSLQIFQQTNGVNILNAGDFTTIPGTQSSTSTSQRVSGGIATTTDTYASQLNNITSGSYSQVSSTVGSNNGYITNIAVLPYIRSQQLIFKAKGLLVNAPVSAWFDGDSIDSYITSPNTVELTNVQGTFKEDDVVGFFFSNVFYPTARVISVYKYPSSNNARLYVADVIGAPDYTPTSVIQNAQYNSSGVYAGSTANASINGASTSLAVSGQITGVGGSYTPVGGGTAFQIYRVMNTHSWGTFMNQYAVWGNLSKTATFNATYNIDVDTAANYTIIGTASCATTIRIDGVAVLSVSNPATTTSNTVFLSSGTHSVSWTSSGSAGVLNGVALVAKDPDGNIVYESTVPPNVTYDSVAQEIIMPNGGAWFTGVTKFKLDAKASSTPNYYVGAKVRLTSKFVYAYTTETATYVPPPPRRRGGGCFTKDTIVMIEGGKNKKISEIVIGDKVLNWNKTSFNTVKFIEKVIDTELGSLYSPTEKYEAFATINHPIYIQGELCSPISDIVYEMYPWLGRTKQIETARVAPAKGELVYNLWVDGDGTYTVNGYGTTSIIGDGGVLRIATERGDITDEHAAKLLMKFISKGKNTVYGAYLLNKFFGQSNKNFGVSVMIQAFKDDTKPILQKIVMTTFKVVGKIACIINNK
jgi:hypothetical protein